MGRHGEGQLDVHAAGIALHRGIDELLDLGKLDDLLQLARGLGPVHAQYRAVEVDVVPAAELGVEAGADLKQTGHAAPDANLALGGRGDAADQLQQRGFARAVAPQYRQSVAPLHSEAHVLQGPELLVVGQVLLADLDVGVFLAAHTGEPAGQVAVQRAAADHAQAVLLGDALHFENPF